MRKTATILAAALAAALSLALLSSCASAPKEIPEDLTSRELIQRAQEASDGDNFAAAIAYYEAARERYGYDPAVLATAEYEVSFIYYKQGKYAEAEAGFLSLLARYDGPEGESLPNTFKILAEKLLPKVREAMGKK
ncbi:MAG TPA: hypothetical protein P5165_03515 [Spirochaetia bacterium]|nr:hypothetical protein [Spirochaetales bacterium]HRY72272.1 hypothetical protein [Spirochaetia bacterium]